MPCHLTLFTAAAVSLGGATMAYAQMPGGAPANRPGMATPGITTSPATNGAGMMPMMRGMMEGAGIMEGAGMMPMMRGMMSADHIEGRIAYRKAELKITDAQLPQWNAVAEVLRLNAKAMQDGMATMAKGGMPTTAPARSDLMMTLMSERLDGMKKLSVANKALYAVLTPDQQKIEDDMAVSPMGMM